MLKNVANDINQATDTAEDPMHTAVVQKIMNNKFDLFPPSSRVRWNVPASVSSSC